MSILALADDMTGALEVGAKFSGAGIETVVSAKPLPVGSAPVVVLDTETRHLNAEAAGCEVIRFLREASSKRPSLIYKKTDSTLRGNIQAELLAIARMFPDWSIGYAPAYPALGRTVKDGVLYVHGTAVADTEFARDELNPVRSSSVIALLTSELDGCVFDGEVDAHLAEAAQMILADARMRIAAGPAGLAAMLAAEIDVPRQLPHRYPSLRTCLLLNGSRHVHSARQTRHVPVAEWQVLPHMHRPSTPPTEVAAINARNLIQRTSREDPDSIFVIGGDTAFAVVRELGLPLLSPIGEIVPGVPVTRIAIENITQTLPHRRRDLFLITKAGGFGDDDVLTRVHAELSHGERSSAG